MRPHIRAEKKAFLVCLCQNFFFSFSLKEGRMGGCEAAKIYTTSEIYKAHRTIPTEAYWSWCVRVAVHEKSFLKRALDMFYTRRDDKMGCEFYCVILCSYTQIICDNLFEMFNTHLKICKFLFCCRKYGQFYVHKYKNHIWIINLHMNFIANFVLFFFLTIKYSEDFYIVSGCPHC